MNNYLNNGTVLPYGLLGCNLSDFSRGFNKTYKNTALRVGMVINSYDVNDSNNLSKLTTEYDVVAIQQDEDKGVSSTTYKNCMSSEGMGSIADYFEKNLRVQTKLNTDASLMDFKGQDGPIVLLLCLDSLSERAIIISSVTHPDRPTTLTSSAPQLSGEYNGVKVEILPDGSCSLAFKGATDNQGIPTDPSQGTTEFQIKTDGSFQLSHSTITISADKSGVLTITTSGDSNIMVGGDCNLTATGKAVIMGSEIDLNGSEAQVLTTLSDPIVDSIYGEPTMGFATVKTGS